MVLQPDLRRGCHPTLSARSAYGPQPSPGAWVCDIVGSYGLWDHLRVKEITPSHQYDIEGSMHVLLTMRSICRSTKATAC